MIGRCSLKSIVAVVCCVFILLGSGTDAGTIVSWGSNDYSLIADTPEGNDFIDVAAGTSHSVALKTDGTVVAWGRADDNRLAVPDANDIVAIAAGYDFSLALRSDGTIVGWGKDDKNQITNIPTDDGFVAIAAGGLHGIALKQDGSVVTWGDAALGKTEPQEGNNFIAVAGGNFVSLAIEGDSEGAISIWGYTGLGLSSIPAGSDFVAIDGGQAHGLALRTDGTLAAWGADSLSYNKGQVTDTPTDAGHIAIDTGNLFNVALKDNRSLVAWGDNTDEQTDVPEGNDYVAIAAGQSHALAISEPGSLALTSPNGGDIFKTGTFKMITWDTEGTVNDVKVEFSTDNGASWNPVAPANEGNTGDYEWLVPLAMSQESLVRVRPGLSMYGSDTSDAPFTIYRCELAGDVTGDCIVDIADLAVLASEWLVCAYPFISEPLFAGDFNGDDKVNAADLMVLGSYWLDTTCGSCEWCEGADMDKSGSVNMVDLARFCSDWMAGTEG